MNISSNRNEKRKKIPFRQRGFPKLPKLDNGFTTFSFLAKNVKFAQFILYIFFAIKL